jgi:hypothetical protein
MYRTPSSPQMPYSKLLKVNAVAALPASRQRAVGDGGDVGDGIGRVVSQLGAVHPDGHVAHAGVPAQQADGGDISCRRLLLSQPGCWSASHVQASAPVEDGCRVDLVSGGGVVFHHPDLRKQLLACGARCSM